ncbi:hypothetical protein LSG31_02090 [Fodinisporobacter ferrooxydans]|uniref:Spore coat protein n=1 Tax=Fodinisporobacter ferrooxydans TaxID=2901836 RepID=A0ABY4CKN4_9BACL|nr:hypothetical protein LSG31_02090 [Alicyclobacillaceae bacterium MYW30-H2]
MTNPNVNTQNQQPFAESGNPNNLGEENNRNHKTHPYGLPVNPPYGAPGMYPYGHMPYGYGHMYHPYWHHHHHYGWHHPYYGHMQTYPYGMYGGYGYPYYNRDFSFAYQQPAFFEQPQVQAQPQTQQQVDQQPSASFGQPAGYPYGTPGFETNGGFPYGPVSPTPFYGVQNQGIGRNPAQGGQVIQGTSTPVRKAKSESNSYRGAEGSASQQQSAN